jgi:transposase
MLKNGIEYIETGQDYYEKQYRDRLIWSLNTRAKALGFSLVEVTENQSVRV